MSEIAKHWIDGEWTGSGTVSESVNPATGAVLGRWADGGEAEARAAVAAARRAFESTPWSRDRGLRHRALVEMADRFDAHAEELGTLVTKENGKKIAEGRFEGTSPGPTLRHNAAQALTEHRHLGRGRAGAVVQHLRRAGRRGRRHRPLELSRRPAHPVPGSGPVRGEHRRGQDARADRAGGQPGLADPRRGHVAAPRRGEHLHRIRQHRRALPGGLTRCPGRQLHGQHHGGAHRRRERRSDPQADEPRTRLGFQTLAAAAPGHVAHVRSLVIDVLSPEQLRRLGLAADRIMSRIDTSEINY